MDTSRIMLGSGRVFVFGVAVFVCDVLCLRWGSVDFVFVFVFAFDLFFLIL